MDPGSVAVLKNLKIPGNSLLQLANVTQTAYCPRTGYTDHSSPQNLLETGEFH